MKKNVYFTDGRIWECEVVTQGRDGIRIKMYSKETFYPWHQIKKIGGYRDHLR